MITVETPPCTVIIARCPMQHVHVAYSFGAFELDPVTRQVTAGGERVYLTAPQFNMLELLAERAPDIVDKDALANAGWGNAIS